MQRIYRSGNCLRVAGDHCDFTLKTHLSGLRWKRRKEKKLLDLIIQEKWSADFIDWQRGEFKKDDSALRDFMHDLRAFLAAEKQLTENVIAAGAIPSQVGKAAASL